ncbi:MAG: putative selenate reductase subunit YgfK, partial [Bacteroidota bacterium]
MSDRMTPIPFDRLINWMFSEFQHSKTIFGIPAVKFFYKSSPQVIRVFDETIETPLGPAAGPHTQLAQNIIASYLAGGRFFELKTVQHRDDLAIDKPCIDARDEGYNIEWSQELTLAQSYEEYLKAWFALHLLNDVFHFSPLGKGAFVFNMSVG